MSKNGAAKIIEEVTLPSGGTVKGCLEDIRLWDLTEIVILGRCSKGNYISSSEDDPSELLEEAFQSLPSLLAQVTKTGPGL